MDTVRIYHRPGREPLFAGRRSPPQPRLRHLQHRDQHRLGARPHALRHAGSSLWLALGLRDRRDLHDRGTDHLPERLPSLAGEGRARPGRRGNAHVGRSAPGRGARCRDGAHYLPVDRLFPDFQRQSDPDPAARRPDRPRVRGADTLVPGEQLVLCHPRRPAGARNLAVAGAARPRAERLEQDVSRWPDGEQNEHADRTISESGHPSRPPDSAAD